MARCLVRAGEGAGAGVSEAGVADATGLRLRRTGLPMMRAAPGRMWEKSKISMGECCRGRPNATSYGDTGAL